MHIEEAQWINAVLAEQSSPQLSPLLDIGSSTEQFRTVTQPFIDELIFAPLRQRGVEVIHTDVKNAPGVDMVGDIADPAFRRRLRAKKLRAALCCNLLEHVPAPRQIAEGIQQVVATGGIICVTVPYRYPRHLDPIDTMYRPTPDEICTLFSNSTLITKGIIAVGKPYRSLLQSPGKIIKFILRLGCPWYRFRGWITAVNRLIWLFTTREITCVALRNR